MSTLGKLKRGSMQVQRAAIKAGGRIGARDIMIGMVVVGLILDGVIQHSATVALMALSDPLSSANFAEYVANTSYVNRYCEPDNATAKLGEGGGLSGEDFDNYDLMLPENETTESGHGRHLVATPYVKVPLSEEDNTDSALRLVYLWGTFVSPLPTSRIAARVGPKKVFGPAIVASGLLAGLVPFFWLTPYHMAIRFVQGVFTGATWPSLHMLAATWFPALQRSGFVSCYSAVSLGYALAGLVGTPLVQMWGRDALCYLLSAVTMFWFLLWWYLVYNSPSEHPRLSDEKKQHLDVAIGTKVATRDTVPPLPWRHLLSSGPVWACAVATLGSQWGQFTLHLAVTKYLKLVYGFALTYDRVLSVLPHLGYFLAAILFGRVVDHVRTQPLISTTTSRKLVVYICLFCSRAHFFPAAMLFVVGYSGCDPSAPAALFTAAVVISGATHAGAQSSAIDIAPNFAGTVFGLSQTFGALGSLIACYVVREGLHGSLPGTWRLVFGVSSAVLLGTAIMFMVMGSGSVQPWNDLQKPESRRSSGQPRDSRGGSCQLHEIQGTQVLIVGTSALDERRGSIRSWNLKISDVGVPQVSILNSEDRRGSVRSAKKIQFQEVVGPQGGTVISVVIDGGGPGETSGPPVRIELPQVTAAPTESSSRNVERTSYQDPSVQTL